MSTRRSSSRQRTANSSDNETSSVRQQSPAQSRRRQRSTASAHKEQQRETTDGELSPPPAPVHGSTAPASARPLVVQELYGEQQEEYSYALAGDASPGHVQRRVRFSSVWSLLAVEHWLRGSWAALCSLFLPVGYPSSVTPDYLEFQIYDTIQAVCSYLRGMLCTHAVLTGMGVGEATASATSATLNWVLRDGVGMASGLLFASWGSRSFGANLRGWRLFADVINDVGLTLELISPLFPREHFWLFLAGGCVCRSMCGVSAGATRAALMQHFARAGNVSDLAAKEGIQETAVTLLGMVGGAALMRWLDGDARGTWILFALLTALHVYANWRGVTALVLASLNPQRTDILLQHWVAQVVAAATTEAGPTSKTALQCLTPAQVAQRERLVWWEGSSSSLVHRDDAAPHTRVHRIRVGMALHDLVASGELLQQLARAQTAAEASKGEEASSSLIHLLCPQESSPAVLGVVLRDGCSDQMALRALFHAHIYRALQQQQQRSTRELDGDRASSWFSLSPLFPSRSHARSSPLSAAECDLLQRSTQLCALHFAPLLVALEAAGWTLEHAVLSIEAWRCRWD